MPESTNEVRIAFPPMHPEVAERVIELLAADGWTNIATELREGLAQQDALDPESPRAPRLAESVWTLARAVQFLHSKQPCVNYGEATEDCDCLICRTQTVLTEWEDDSRFKPTALAQQEEGAAVDRRAVRRLVNKTADSSEFILAGNTNEDEDARLLARLFSERGWHYRVDGKLIDASRPLRALERKLAAALDLAANQHPVPVGGLTKEEAAEVVPLIRKANAGIAKTLTEPTDRIADRLEVFAQSPATQQEEDGQAALPDPRRNETVTGRELVEVARSELAYRDSAATGQEEDGVGEADRRRSSLVAVCFSGGPLDEVGGFADCSYGPISLELPWERGYYAFSGTENDGEGGWLNYEWKPLAKGEAFPEEPEALVVLADPARELRRVWDGRVRALLQRAEEGIDADAEDLRRLLDAVPPATSPPVLSEQGWLRAVKDFCAEEAEATTGERRSAFERVELLLACVTAGPPTDADIEWAKQVVAERSEQGEAGK